MALDYVYVVGDTGALLTFGDLGAYVIAHSRRNTTGLAVYSADDYWQALIQLSPEGQAWPTDLVSVRPQLLRALAAELARVEARSAALLAETDPATTVELLPDYERVVGLPDPCVTAAQTLAERRAALEGRLTSVGGQSRAFFIALGLRLGYVVTIDEFPSEAAAIAAGIPYIGDGWAHTWRVNVPAGVTITYFRAGSGRAGEPLRVWSNEVLECQFRRYKPAHTAVLFAYAGG